MDFIIQVYYLTVLSIVYRVVSKIIMDVLFRVYFSHTTHACSKSHHDYINLIAESIISLNLLSCQINNTTIIEVDLNILLV